MSPGNGVARSPNKLQPQFATANANATANAFLGSRQRTWMNSTSATTAAPRPLSRTAPLQQQIASSVSKHQTQYQSQTVLPSPAPSDEPSPAVSNAVESPNPISATLPEVSGDSVAAPPQNAMAAEPRFVYDPGLNATPGLPQQEEQRSGIRTLSTSLSPSVRGASLSGLDLDGMVLSPVNQNGPSAPSPVNARPSPAITLGNQVMGRTAHSRSNSASSSSFGPPPAKRQRVEHGNHASSGQSPGSHRNPAPFQWSSFLGNLDACPGLHRPPQDPDITRPRIHLLKDACRDEDGFFLVLHQLYVLWTQNSQALLALLPQKIHSQVEQTVSCLEQLLKKNAGIMEDDRLFFVRFPLDIAVLQQPNNTLNQSSDGAYSRAYQQVLQFLATMPQSYMMLMYAVKKREWPPLVDELLTNLSCSSVTMQTIVFTASRRILGIRDGPLGIQVDNAFREDQRNHLAKPGVFCPPRASVGDGELERKNAKLIAFYTGMVNRSRRMYMPAPHQQHVHSNRVQTSPVLSASPFPAVLLSNAPPPGALLSNSQSPDFPNGSIPQVDNQVAQQWAVSAAQAAAQQNFGRHPSQSQSSPQGFANPLPPGQNPFAQQQPNHSFMGTQWNQNIIPNQQPQNTFAHQQPNPNLMGPPWNQNTTPDQRTLGGAIPGTSQQPQNFQHLWQPQISPLQQQHLARQTSQQFAILHQQQQQRMLRAHAYQRGAGMRSQQTRLQKPAQNALNGTNAKTKGAPVPQSTPTVPSQATSPQTLIVAQAGAPGSTVPDLQPGAAGGSNSSVASRERPQKEVSTLGPASQLPTAVQQNATRSRVAPPGRHPDAIIPPLNYEIPRPEWPYNPSDPKSITMSLHQANIRSPKRIVRCPNTEPGPHYQAMKSCAVQPTLIGSRHRVHSFQFTVSEEQLQLKTEISCLDNHGPVASHYNGSLRWRLRCCAWSSSGKAPTEAEWAVIDTCWPEIIFLKINGQPLQVRRHQHHGKDLPTELTPHIVVGINEVEVAIGTPTGALRKPDLNHHFVAVEILETLSHDEIKDRVIGDDAHVIPERVTLDIIKKRLEGTTGDDEVTFQATELSIDLADPFESVLWTVPVRGVGCKHLECFDLEIWLETRPVRKISKCAHSSEMRCCCPKVIEPSDPDKWRCPICSKDARPYSLRVDEFLLTAGDQIPVDKRRRMKRLIVNAEGLWHCEEDKDDDDSADEAEHRRLNAVVRKRSSMAVPVSSKTPVEPDVIVLDSD